MACTAESTPDCDDTKKAFRRSTPPSPNWPNSAGRNSTRASKVPRSALRSGRARVKSSSFWNSVRYAPVRSRPRARFSSAEDAGLFWGRHARKAQALWAREAGNGFSREPEAAANFGQQEVACRTRQAPQAAWHQEVACEIVRAPRAAWQALSNTL